MHKVISQRLQKLDEKRNELRKLSAEITAEEKAIVKDAPRYASVFNGEDINLFVVKAIDQEIWEITGQTGQYDYIRISVGHLRESNPTLAVTVADRLVHNRFSVGQRYKISGGNFELVPQAYIESASGGLEVFNEFGA